VLDGDLVHFLQSTFRSVWSLEVLTVLHGRPGQDLSIETLIREVRGSRPVVAQSLEALQAGGLVVPVSGDTIRYAPASDDLVRLSEAAVRAYRERPGEVRRLVLAGPTDKLQSFADAFKFRRDP
jgi:hypothetical protein